MINMPLVRIELLGLISDKLSGFPSATFDYQFMQGDLLFLESHAWDARHEFLFLESH